MYIYIYIYIYSHTCEEDGLDEERSEDGEEGSDVEIDGWAEQDRKSIRGQRDTLYTTTTNNNNDDDDNSNNDNNHTNGYIYIYIYIHRERDHA